MSNKILPRFLIGLCVATLFLWTNQANARTPLTKAEIKKIRNIVQLIRKNNSQVRPARQLDTITPGDGVSTGRSSLADLRFNDGSIARVGEQAIFQFLPQTRNFTLSNGTVLLLIPPGRGTTRIKTPNAAAAIRGSALFVRYNQKSDTTIVGALTNSGIEVANKQASEKIVLNAGQLMVVVKGTFQGLYDFDLRSFYENSNLVRGLNLNKQNSIPTLDPALASIQSETVAAIQAQKPVIGKGTIDNPSFLNKNFNSTAASKGFNNSSNNTSHNNSNQKNFGRGKKDINPASANNLEKNSIRGNSLGVVDNFVGTGEIIRENRQIINPSQKPGNNPGNVDDVPGGGNTNNPGNVDDVPGGGNTNNPGNVDDVPGGGNTNNPGNVDDVPGGGNTNNPGNSDGVPGGGNTNNPGNSDGVPGGGNTNNPGNSDGVPGGGNTNNPGNSDGVPGGGNTNNPGNSDGVPGGGNTNNPGNSNNNPGNSNNNPGNSNNNPGNSNNNPGNSNNNPGNSNNNPGRSDDESDDDFDDDFDDD